MLRTTLRLTALPSRSPILSTTTRSVTSNTSSSDPNANSSSSSDKPVQPADELKAPNNTETPTHKTQAQLDQELQDKMAGLSGDGGASGVEYENGEPVAMKRSVKSNMFRYI